VSRSLAQLARQGYVAMTANREDRRERSVRLTKTGRHLVAHVQSALFVGVQAAAEELCADLQGSFLEELAELDRRLASIPFSRRIEDQVHAPRA